MPRNSVHRASVASCTNVGRVRQHNEDAVLLNEELGLFVVSDGMGGQQAGAVASQAVVQVLPTMIDQRIARFSKPTNSQVREALRDAVAELSRQLFMQSRDQTGVEGMGATVVLALIRGRYAHIAHLGDSRAYLFRGGRLTQLTDDHSVVAILLRAGRIAPAQVQHHPASGQLSRFVGMAGFARPDVRTIAFKRGDWLLLCTDGLTGMINDQRIADILKNHSDGREACKQLVAAANEAGGKDNVTVVTAAAMSNNRSRMAGSVDWH